MCRGGYRSEARYVVSEDTGTTKGVGWVTALAGIIRFSKPSHEATFCQESLIVPFVAWPDHASLVVNSIHIVLE